MKLGVICWLLLCGALARLPAAPSRASAGVTQTISVSGKTYVRVVDWARLHQFEPAWIKRGEIVGLRNGHGTRLTLTVDSKQAEFNGIGVHLLFPIVEQHDVVYLSHADVDSTLRPLLSPRCPPGEKIKTVCLDPGHGGKDPGFRVSGHEEKKYTLLLAKEVRQQLVEAGYKVFLTRGADEFIDLPMRAEVAKKKNADLFVSLHFNALPSSPATVRGAEVFCLTPAGAPSSNAQGEGGSMGLVPANRFNDRNLALAFQMQKSLVQNLGAEDRGVKRARFAVLREAGMPAILIEGGFMSHPSEGKKIFDANYRQKMARAIVSGLQNYKRLVQAEPGANG
jgi:N-acetylmuramoyl-L-alanine amidase